MRRKLAVSATLATLATVLSITPSIASRAEAAPRALTIDDAVALALRTNPQLAAARARAESGDINAVSVGRRMLPSIHLNEEAQLWNKPFIIPFPAANGGTQLFKVRNQDTNTFSASFDQPLMGLFRANDERETLT